MTKLFCPPTVWIALLATRTSTPRPVVAAQGLLRRVDHARRGAARAPRRLPDVRLFNLYGQTEMAPLATFLGPEDQVRKAGSAGQAGAERGDADRRRRRPPGRRRRGRRDRAPLVRRRCSATGTTPEKTAEMFRNGWLHTGDLGILDDEGYIYVVDRKKDMIKSGGENVASPRGRGGHLRSPGGRRGGGVRHPRPAVDRSRRRRRRAARRPRAAEPEEIIALLPRAPRRVQGPQDTSCIVDELPKNPSGKILKRELRTTHAGLAKETNR